MEKNLVKEGSSLSLLAEQAAKAFERVFYLPRLGPLACLPRRPTHPHPRSERASTYVSLPPVGDTFLHQRKWMPMCGVRFSVRVSRVGCSLEQAHMGGGPMPVVG